MRAKRLILMTVLALATSWSGPERRPILGTRADIEATPVALDPGDPKRTRVGALTYLGGVALWSHDGAFGGFSSMSIAGDRFTLLSDGGTIARFRMDAKFRISEPWFGDLPAGPGLGWDKSDRDSESMTVDPGSGQVWVGFERYNQIWRYAPGLTLPAAMAAPRAMAGWDDNGGAESMVRLRDGRFLVVAETTNRPGSHARQALLFDGDPVVHPNNGFRFGYLPPDGYDPSDATQLPDGRILVLNRKLALPFAWSAVLTLIHPRALKPGAIVAGTEIARFAAPLTVDNFEGLAVTREGPATILWMVSDDNLFVFQRTLLMKFRLDF
ncbi:MAG: esterase-like activity of phytase family protein [Sphingomonas sp.]|uniref:esterase-like activity of phytase family protein n=1 Tax=Sphingomonas sp. TaxID=28214 RepID=UPI0012264467|nr:esterase-like activity of phytase family protein [Sphingomonas sp.]THD35613.1 MAG: esterase-like activity of phytase family protein [Sphingomonas sp.]